MNESSGWSSGPGGAEWFALKTPKPLVLLGFPWRLKYPRMPEIKADRVIFWDFAMQPFRPSSGKNDLFRERLDAIINPRCRDRLVRLSGLMLGDTAFGSTQLGD